MSESKYWMQFIEWLEKTNSTFTFHNSHKTELANDLKFGTWIKNFEKNKMKIPVHSLKIKNSYIDFLSLKTDDFEDVHYVYAIEVKGEIGRSDFNRGLMQAKDAKEGVDYSVLLIPESYVKPDYKKTLNEEGLLLGIIKKDGGIKIQNEEFVKASFNPREHNKLLNFLLIIKQRKNSEIISKIKSQKTIFLHYVIPGFIKFLYQKYENKNLSDIEIGTLMETHWGQLIPIKKWKDILKNTSETNKPKIKGWKASVIKDFIKKSRQFGFFNNNSFLYSNIELYLNQIDVLNKNIFNSISNNNIGIIISRFFNCAEDMKGRGHWLFLDHKLLADNIINFLSNRKDMRTFINWIKDIMIKVEKKDNSGLNFRDIVDKVAKDNFLVMKEFFIKDSIGERKIEEDLCIQPINQIKCPFSTEWCYGKSINSIKELIKFNDEVFNRFNSVDESIGDYLDIPKEFHEENDKLKPLRYGIIKSLVRMQIFYNFKRNLIHLGFFPEDFVRNNKLLSQYNNYPLGNDTRLGRYCPFLDRWTIDLENDAILFK